MYDQLWLYHNITKPATNLAFAMEKNGILIDPQKREEVQIELMGQIIEVEEKIWEIAEVQFKVSSPPELSNILFNKIGLPVLERSKATKEPSTKEQVIRELYASEESCHPILPYVIEYRNLNKLLNSYVINIQQFIGADGRVHSSVFVTGTETGRWTFRDPALQTIPKKEDISGAIKKRGMIVRKLFVARPGYVLVNLDLVQAEIRILGYYSRDEELLRAAREHIDMHSIVACAIFKEDLKEFLANKKTDQHIMYLRDVAKNIGFGWLYLGTCKGLRSRIPLLATIPLAELEQGQKNYFEKLYRVKEFQHEVIHKLIETGEIVNCYGRVRHLPQAIVAQKWSDFIISHIIEGTIGKVIKDREEKRKYMTLRDVFKEGLNALIQGTSHDFLSLSLIPLFEWIQKEEFPAYPLLECHDNGLFEVEESKADEFLEMAKAIIEEPKEPVDIPMGVEAEVGENWFDMKEYKFAA